MNSAAMMMFFQGDGIRPTSSVSPYVEGSEQTHEADFWWVVEVTTIPANGRVDEMPVRQIDVNNQLELRVYGSTAGARIYVAQFVSGNPTYYLFGPAAGVINDGQTIYIRADGGTVSVWVNDTLIETKTGYTHVTGTYSTFEARAPADWGTYASSTFFPLSANLKELP
jgi:hypothetical protein